MKIGILQTGKVPDELQAEHGDYPDMFARWLADPAFTFETYPVVDKVFPDSPDACDAWLITGSKHGAYEDHDWIPPLEKLIRQASAAGIPVVGICFGHQIMAQALGGKVEKFSGGWSVGVEDYAIEGIGDNVLINAWHQDQVVDLPGTASVVGSSPICRYAALRYGDHGFSIQPH
ncbi:MAG: type 1 glutamine amidotransferase, partial [Geminicoccaceae bacterium]